MTDETNNRRSADLIIAKIEGKVDLLFTAVMEIRTWLMGDGTPNNPGVMIRLDRLEQVRQNQMRHWMVVYTIIAGIIVHTVWRHIIVTQEFTKIEKSQKSSNE